jgi:tRNA (adenine57-N1/adenine58-N1)-methyltransferase
VCREGFGLSNVADCVFLDLPAPWDALESAKEALRLDVAGRVCCFSPCIEQVLRTAEAMRKQGWCEIETFESLVRNHESLSQARTAPLVPVGDAIRKIREVEANKSQRRLGQIERSRRARVVKERAAALVAEGVAEKEAQAQAEAETAQAEANGDEEMQDPRDAAEEALATATPWTVKLPDPRENVKRELSQANVYSRTLQDVSCAELRLRSVTMLTPLRRCEATRRTSPLLHCGHAC